MNATNTYGQSALVFGITRDMPDNVRLLIAAGANVNIKLKPVRENRDQTSPLALAKRMRRSNIASMLQEAGARE